MDAVEPARLELKSSQDCPKREDVGSAHPPCPNRAPGNTTRGQAFGLVCASPLDP